MLQSSNVDSLKGSEAFALLAIQVSSKPLLGLLGGGRICHSRNQLPQKLTTSVRFCVRFYCLPSTADGGGVFLSKAEHLDLLSLVTDWFSSAGKMGVTAVSTHEQRQYIKQWYTAHQGGREISQIQISRIMPGDNDLFLSFSVPPAA